MPRDELDPQDAAMDAAHLRDELTKECHDYQISYPRFKDELEKAKEQIGQENKLSPTTKLRAFNRARDAIIDGIKVFISFKSDDEGLANLIKRKISDYGTRRLSADQKGDPDIFIAAQNLIGGDDWRQTIREKIEETHWFILLLPDIDIDRDWVIWEAGYFERGMCKEAGEKLIVVHHPHVSLASQIENYQSISSTPKEIAKLFDDLFFSPNAITGMNVIAGPLKRDDLTEDAKEISEKFYGRPAKITPVFCLTYTDLKHGSNATYASVTDLLEAEVLQAHGLKDVFNRNDNFKGKFGDLISDVYDEAHGKAWVDALCQALGDAVADRPPRPVVVPFVGYGNHPKQFRAYLHCVRRQGASGPISNFHVIFVEEFGVEVSHAPAELDALETTLRWSYRSWWEVMNRYRHRTLSKQEELRALMQYTERAEQEARARNAAEPRLLLSAFNRYPEKMEKLKKFQAIYHEEYRNPVTGAGKIDRAFRDQDLQLMGECLQELRPNIAWFLLNGAKIYAELLEEQLKHDLPGEETTPT